MRSICSLIVYDVQDLHPSFVLECGHLRLDISTNQFQYWMFPFLRPSAIPTSSLLGVSSMSTLPRSASSSKYSGEEGFDVIQMFCNCFHVFTKIGNILKWCCFWNFLPVLHLCTTYSVCTFCKAFVIVECYVDKCTQIIFTLDWEFCCSTNENTCQ